MKKYTHRGVTYPLRLKGSEMGMLLLDWGPLAPGLRYQSRVWDKDKVVGELGKGKRGGYKSDRFADETRMREEANRTRARFNIGLEGASRLYLEDIKADFLAYKARKNGEASLKEITGLVNGMQAFGINDLKDERLVERTLEYLAARGRVPRKATLSTKPETIEWRKKWLAAKIKKDPDYLAKRKVVSSDTLARYITHIRSLGRYIALRPRYRTPANPWQALEGPTKSNAMPATFNVDESRQLVSDKAMDTWTGRLYALLLLSGMREQEGAWLRWRDVRWDSRMIAVVLEDGKAVKRDKERIVIVVDELYTVLRSWFVGAKPEPATGSSILGEDFLFPKAVREMKDWEHCKEFVKHLAKLGIPKGKRSIHKMRHTHACLMLASGTMDTLELVEHLGHDEESTTRRYTRPVLFYRRECKDWNRQIFLRRPVPTACNARATRAPEHAGDSSDSDPAISQSDSELFVVGTDDGTDLTNSSQANQGTFNLWVAGSIPAGRINPNPDDDKEVPDWPDMG